MNSKSFFFMYIDSSFFSCILTFLSMGVEEMERAHVTDYLLGVDQKIPD